MWGIEVIQCSFLIEDVEGFPHQGDEMLACLEESEFLLEQEFADGLEFFGVTDWLPNH